MSSGRKVSPGASLKEVHQAHDSAYIKNRTEYNDVLLYRNHLATWSSDIEDYHLTGKYAKGRQIKHLEIRFKNPLPESYRHDNLLTDEYLCLRHSQFGGVWKVFNVSEDRSVVACNTHRDMEGFDIEKQMFNWEVDNSEVVISVDDKSNDANVCVVHRAEESDKTPYAFFLPPLVFVSKCNILSITSVDTVTQSFVGDIQVDFRLRQICDQQVDAIDFRQFLSVMRLNTTGDRAPFHCTNLLEEKKDIEVWTVDETSFSNPNRRSFGFRMRIRALFAMQMKISKFPFDQQHITFDFMFSRPFGNTKFIQNYEFNSKFAESNFLLQNTFGVPFGEIVFTRFDLTSPAESSSGIIYRRISFEVTLTRRSGFYVTNMAVPMMLFCTLTLSSFGLSRDGESIDTADRLSITLTLLLTAVAYKFVVASVIPPVSYLTLLDKYVWSCLLYIFIVAAVNVLLPAIGRGSEEHRQQVDEFEVTYLLLIMALLLIGFNVGFAVHVWRILVRQDQRNEQDYQRYQRSVQEQLARGVRSPAVLMPLQNSFSQKDWKPKSPATLSSMLGFSHSAVSGTSNSSTSQHVHSSIDHESEVDSHVAAMRNTNASAASLPRSQAVEQRRKQLKQQLDQAYAY